MAVKIKLSDEEKEKAKKLLGMMTEKKEETKKKTKQKSEVAPTVGAKSSRDNKKANIPSYRQSSTSIERLPKASRIATKEETKNTKAISSKELKARKEAEKANKEIEKGGYHRVNQAITNVLSSFQSGVQKGTSGLANSVLIPIASQLQNYSNIAKKIGLLDKNTENVLDKAYNKILDSSDYISEQANYQDYLNSNIKNKNIRTAGNVSSVIGNMMPSIISNVALPGSGLVVTGLSSGGNSAQETINEDRNNLNQAVATGIIKGGTEALTEKITGGNILSKGSLDDVAGKFISNKVKSEVGKKILNTAYNFGGEMLEEQISDNVGYVVDKVINNQDMPSLKKWWNNAGETNKITFLSTLALNLVGLGGRNVSNEYDAKMQSMLNEVTEVAKNDPDIQQQVQNIQEQLKNNSNTDTKIQQDIQNPNIEPITDTLPVANEKNRYTKSQLDEMLNNKDLPMQSYQYVKSDNAKVDNFRKEASIYFNNSEKARNYIDMLEKIIIDKDIQIRLDDNLKTSDGKIANGSYSNGVITINPNSNRVGEFIAIHELTHAIGTKDMISMIKNYRNINEEFDTAVEQLLKNYNTNEINEESLADVSAQLFGNQEFINNIAQENPSIFKKIYSEIKYLWHQFRGYKNQQQFIDDLYYKWTQAYNSNNKLNNSENYLKAKLDNGESTIVSDDINGTNPTETQARKSLEEMLGITYINENNSKQISIENKDIGKFLHDGYNNYKNARLKKRIAGNYGEVIEIAKENTQASKANYKGSNRGKQGFDYYSVNLSYPIRDNQGNIIDYKSYTARLVVRKDNGGNFAYDLDNFAIKNGATLDKTSLSIASDSSDSGSFINNSIPSQNRDVNTTTKYSIQESENNSWQQYLDKNFKSEGTRTNLSDIRLQTAKENTAPSAKNNVAETSNIKNSWSTKQEEVENEEKIAQILEQPIEKVKEKDRTWAIMKANLVDKGIVFEELSHKTKNRELQGKWDYTLTASARGQNAIGQARYEMDSKTKTEKQICKGLEDIRSEVGNKANDFQNYMYHQLNIDRMTLEDRFGGDTGLNYERKSDIKNKPVFSESVTAEISQKIVNQYEQKNPEFKKWAKDIYDFNNANKQELVKNGVISQELADTLGELYPHYVPIKRVNTNGSAIKVPLDTNRTGVNSPLARAKGGNSDIQPLFQTLAERTMQTYTASARNNFGVELINTLNSVQEKQQTDIDTILEDIGNTEQNAELLQEGKNGNVPTFTVFNNGEKVTFEITKDMYDALKPLSDSSILNKNLFKGIPGKISNFRRGVLTEYNPLFLITNAAKDVQEVLINSQHALKTYSKFPEAYQQIISKGYWYNEYVRNGGEQNSYFKDGKFESDAKFKRAKSALTLPLKAISKVNNVIEMAPRLAEYIASREKGVSIETSMLNASRVTTNFKAGGDITKALNRNGFTFLNASVQGASQQVRNIVEANTKGLKGYAVLATKYAIAGLPTLILNGLLWKDDEDYEELQDYVKDNYYIVGKYGDDKFIRIPKGRTTAVIQKLVNNVSKYVNKDKELNIDNFAKDFWTDLQFGFDNLAPNNPFDNNVISPILQVASNKSWYGEDIVPFRLQDKPKAEQYDESTDSLSIWLGNKLNISPYKINYLLDQYGGGISDVALPMMTKQAENNPIEDKFTTDSVMKSRYPGEFFSKVDELKVNSNSDKATNEDKLKYKWIREISKTMNDYYKEKREIQNSDLSDEEKKKQLRVVQQKINSLSKDSATGVDNIKVNGDTANVNGTSYYKYKGEWTKLSEDDTKKTKNISTDTYSDYRNKVYNITQTRKASGEIPEDGQLKDKDKMQILLDSNYLNKEKQGIYENYILDSSDKKYDIVKETFTDKGLNINKYLEYKSQEFEADKKDDGTVKGKSIFGSKKEKVFDYIDSIEGASYTQKVILKALEYKPSSSYDKNIVRNFVKNLPKKTDDEKLDIMSKFKGVTVYKDGTFEY